MKPTHIMEGNLLHLKSPDYRCQSHLKTAFRATSRLVFNQTTRHYNLVRLTHKIEHNTYFVVVVVVFPTSLLFLGFFFFLDHFIWMDLIFMLMLDFLIPSSCLLIPLAYIHHLLSMCYSLSNFFKLYLPVH